MKDHKVIIKSHINLLRYELYTVRGYLMDDDNNCLAIMTDEKGEFISIDINDIKIINSEDQEAIEEANLDKLNQRGLE